MQEVIFYTKKTWFKNITQWLSAAVILLFTLVSMSFKNPGDPKKSENSSRTSSDSTKGFKSLLGTNTNTEAITEGRFDLNPKAVPFVTDYLSKQSNYFEGMKTWGQPYFTMYEKILSGKGIPVELKYLSVIESSLQTGIVSSAGALGPWQLMPDEARRFGLKVTSAYDERNNFAKSTEAASKLLKELYAQFDDWLLVIAAYNAGAGGVRRAIKKAGSSNFWDLQVYLPEETRAHVKKYIAAHYFFEGSGGWTTLTASESKEKKSAILNLQNRLEDTLLVKSMPQLELSGKYNSVVIANNLLMDIELFNRLNPLFDNTLSEGKPYNLRLPADKMDIFKNKRQLMLYESVQLLLASTIAESGTK